MIVGLNKYKNYSNYNKINDYNWIKIILKNPTRL